MVATNMVPANPNVNSVALYIPAVSSPSAIHNHEFGVKPASRPGDVFVPPSLLVPPPPDDEGVHVVHVDELSQRVSVLPLCVQLPKSRPLSSRIFPPGASE
jgi:hypothetical protein